jgi:hypothetical protein
MTLPIPSPQTWADCLVDLKAEGKALLLPIVNFEAVLLTKDTAQIVEAAAAVPQQFTAVLPGVGAEVLSALLSVAVAKADAALTTTPAPTPVIPPTSA